MVDPKVHADQRGWIESVLRHVPGFQGYLEAEYRRESDLLVRRHIYNRLGAAKKNIDEFQHQLVNTGNLDDIGVYERVVSGLVALGNRIIGDVRGYSGFFAFVKIGTEELDRIYEHDLALVADVEALIEQTKQLPTMTEPRPFAAKLREQVDQISNKFDARAKILQGLAQ